MRKPLMVGNWKMHFTSQQAIHFASQLAGACHRFHDLDVGVAPPATALHGVVDSLRDSGIFVAAQNCHWEKSGAYTGEISAEMVKEIGCSHVILGHSERRTLFGESDPIIKKKLRAALRADLSPILCIGETLDQRQAGNTFQVIERQLQNAFGDLTEKEARLSTLAYEPVWAIGTGKTASAQEAQQAHAFLRSVLVNLFGTDTADKIRIQYGGSVKPENAGQLMAQPDVDGALIGGASLQLENFLGILGYRSLEQ